MLSKVSVPTCVGRSFMPGVSDTVLLRVGPKDYLGETLCIELSSLQAAQS